jgi:hypothetical protein
MHVYRRGSSTPRDREHGANLDPPSLSGFTLLRTPRLQYPACAETVPNRHSIMLKRCNPGLADLPACPH